MRRELFAAIVFTASMSSSPSFAFPFQIEGRLQVTVQDAPENVDRVLPAEPVTERTDGAGFVGVHGNFANAHLSADLASGAIHAVADAQNASSDGGIHWRYATSEAFVEMKDTLSFLVPAGSYPDGVRATLVGSVDGSVRFEEGVDPFGLDGSARATWFVTLEKSMGTGIPFDGETVANAASPGPFEVSEPFSVGVYLVVPGTTLFESLVVDYAMRASLAVSARATNESASAGGAADFEHTLQIASLDVPEHVTWSSASGVFLPEPRGTALVALATLMASGARRRR